MPKIIYTIHIITQFLKKINCKMKKNKFYALCKKNTTNFVLNQQKHQLPLFSPSFSKSAHIGSQPQALTPYKMQNTNAKKRAYPDNIKTKNRQTGGFCKPNFALKQVYRHFSAHVNAAIVGNTSITFRLVF